MWAYFCWLQKSWVCRLILKTMPSCPGLTPTLHSTIGLTAGSVECSPLHQWKASHGGHLHFKKKTFSKFANTFNDNHMWWLFFIWWHLTTLKWTGATLCTLTMDIMWLFAYGSVFAVCSLQNSSVTAVAGILSSCMEVFKLQMVAQTPVDCRSFL